MSDDLRTFRIERLINGVLTTLTVKARNLNDAKAMADEIASGAK